MKTTKVEQVQQGAKGQAAAFPISHLELSNPATKALVQKYPELGVFLARQAKAGAIADVAPGTVATPITWNIWSHSPASLGSAGPWRDQFIFIYQKNPGDKSTIDFGKEGQEAGKLVAVYRMGDIDFPLKKRGSLDAGTSGDGGFEMQVVAQGRGKAGEKAELFFATGCLDKKGNPTGGWGMGLGYSGREHNMVNGTAVEAPIHEDNHRDYSVLRKLANGTWQTKVVPKPAGTP